ncbi:MAG: hypothetical protein H0S85_01425 [Desulfovibrionaceae bacterium]|jgi:hypothetical protein|nr:hypothetical protein [Desulfovibrionaceae bacterium]
MLHPLLVLVGVAFQALVSALVLRMWARIYWKEFLPYRELAVRFATAAIGSLVLASLLNLALAAVGQSSARLVHLATDALAVYVVFARFYRLPDGEPIPKKRIRTIVIGYLLGWGLVVSLLVSPLLLAMGMLAGR